MHGKDMELEENPVNPHVPTSGSVSWRKTVTLLLRILKLSVGLFWLIPEYFLSTLNSMREMGGFYIWQINKYFSSPPII